jgi:hypothetical protein
MVARYMAAAVVGWRDSLMIESNGHTTHTVLGYIVFPSAFLMSVFNVLPTVVGLIAGATAFIWYVVQIYESKTYGAWVQARRLKFQARLDAKKKIADALVRSDAVLAKAAVEADEKIRAARAEAAELMAVARAEASTVVVASETAAIAKVATDKAAASGFIPPSGPSG